MGRFPVVLAVALLTLTVATTSDGKKKRPLSCYKQMFADLDKCITCNLFQRKKVTLIIRNQLKEPFFEETEVLKCTTMKTLFYMMQDAADANPKFRFSVSYDHAGHPGFFVNAFNDVYSTWEEDESWWEILDGKMKHTPVGASSYVPSNGETVTFNLTRGFHSS